MKNFTLKNICIKINFNKLNQKKRKSCFARKYFPRLDKKFLFWNKKDPSIYFMKISNLPLPGKRLIPIARFKVFKRHQKKIYKGNYIKKKKIILFIYLKFFFYIIFNTNQLLLITLNSILSCLLIHVYFIFTFSYIILNSLWPVNFTVSNFAI